MSYPIIRPFASALIFLLITSGVFAQNGEAFIISPDLDSSASVPLHHKLEIGITLPDAIQHLVDDFIGSAGASGLNPYDPQDIDVYGFFSTASKPDLNHRINAFYYLPFRRNPERNLYEPDHDAPFPDCNWRLRFSPDEPGYWTCKVQVVVNQVTHIIPTEVLFFCNTSSHPGYLIRHFDQTEGKYSRWLEYSTSGATFFANAINLPAINFGAFNPEIATKQRAIVNSFADSRINFLKIQISPPDFLPDWPNCTDYSGKQGHMWEMDQLVELCFQRGIYFWLWRHHFELNSIGPPGANGLFYDSWGWELNPYNTSFGLSGKVDFYTNPEVQRWFFNATRYMIARWGYSPGFTGFGLSELLATTDKPDNNGWLGAVFDANERDYMASVSSIKPWFAQFRDAVKQNSFRDRILFILSPNVVDVNELYNPASGILELSDIICWHPYGMKKKTIIQDMFRSANYPDFPHGSEQGAGWDAEMPKGSGNMKQAHYYPTWGKPLMISEMGPSQMINCRTMNHFLTSIWATSFLGTFGTGLHWDSDEIYDFGYYPYYALIADFFEGEDLISGDFRPQRWSTESDKWYLPSQHLKRIEESEIECITLLAADKERALGWVHNAPSYWRNIYNTDSCIAQLIQNEHNGCPPCILPTFLDDNRNPMTRPHPNNQVVADYSDFSLPEYEDAFTSIGSFPIDAGDHVSANPRFRIYDLRKSSPLQPKHWYVVEFYSTISSDPPDPDNTQTLPTNSRGELMPHIPDCGSDRGNAWAYKVAYLGTFKRKPAL